MAESTLWLGSQDSFEAAKAAAAKAEAHPEFKAGLDMEEFIYNHLVSVQDGVGMVNISGPLVSGSAGFGAFFGITGYNDVRNAMLRLSADKSVNSILLVIDSGGGAVGGVQDASTLISRVGKVKPVVAYTGSCMASAALWLGTTAQHVMASSTAIVGSIGILQVHMEFSRQMENNGVKATVIRAGDNKALANRYEPLTEKARNDLQAQADHLYDVFIGHMAETRGISVQAAEKKFGQGREFIGEQAKEAGLVNSIGTLEDAFAKAQALGRKASTGNSGRAAPNSRNIKAVSDNNFTMSSDNPAIVEGTTVMKLNVMTDEQLAAAAAGVELGDTVETVDTAAETQTAAATVDTDGDDTEEVETTVSAETHAAVVAELEQAKATLTAATTEIEQLKQTAESQATQFDAAIEIVRNSVRTMGLHFGVKKEAVAAMSATEVLAEHSRVAEQFKIKFKVGTVAAAGSTETPESDKPVVNARLMAYAATLTSGKR